MCRQDATLGSCGWRHVEVKLLVAFLFSHQLGVYDASSRRVPELAGAILHEESLVDSFVDDDQRDLRSLIVWPVCLLQCFFELRDFSIEDLLSLSITDPISVDNEIGRKQVAVLVLEGADGFLEGLLHLGLDNLLALPLDQVLAVVLTHGLVDRCCETHN